jgi:hypothetical protein
MLGMTRPKDVGLCDCLFESGQSRLLKGTSTTWSRPEPAGDSLLATSTVFGLPDVEEMSPPWRKTFTGTGAEVCKTPDFVTASTEGAGRS